MNTATKRMISASQTMDKLAVKSINTIRRLMDEEGFPKPYQIMQGRNSWDEAEVDAWLDQRKAEQRQQVAA